MYKKLFVVLISLFMSLTVLPQSIYAEEEPADTEEITDTEEIEQEEETIPEEIIEEEEIISEDEEPVEEMILEEELAEAFEEGEIEESVEPEPEEVTIEEEILEPISEEETPVDEEPEETVPEKESTEVITEVEEESVAAEKNKDAEPNEYDNAELITVGDKYMISGRDGDMYYKFIPEESGPYSIYLQPAEDYYTSGQLYNSEKTSLSTFDYSWDADTYWIDYELNAGETYYLRIRIDLDDSASLYVAKNKVYTVTFNGNGGTINGESTKSETFFDNSINELYVTAPVAKKTNSNFLGWSTSNTATTAEYEEYDDIEVTGSITYYAVWQNYYKVIFDFNGGNINGKTTKTVYVDPDDPIIMNSPSLDLDRKVFLGWSTSKTATEAKYEEYEDIPVSADITYYAVWQDYYKVILNANGGTIKGATTKTYYINPYDSELYLPELIFDNKIHLGWSTSKTATTAKYEAGDYFNVTKSITLYAVWQDYYKVVINGNGGKIDGSASQTYYINPEDPEIYLPEITQKYKKLVGWSTSKTATTAKYKTDNYITISGDVTYYAVWKDNYIKFDANGGYFKTSDVTVKKKEYNTDFQLPQTVQNSNKHKLLLGWSTSKTAKKAAYAPGDYVLLSKTAKDVITYYAVWADCYILTVYGNTGKFRSGNTKETYKIIHGKSIETMDDDISLLGVDWTTGSSIITLSNKDEHKTFAGFAKTKTAKKAAFSNDTLQKKVLTADLTVYAIWDLNYIVKYNVNYAKGGRWEYDKTNSSVRKDIIKVGQTSYPWSAVYKDSSKALAGWSTNKDATTPMYFGVTGNDSFKPTKDITLYAVWLPVRTITFNPGNGYWEGSNPNSNKKYRILDGYSYSEGGCIDGWWKNSNLNYSDNSKVLVGWSATKGSTSVIDQLDYYRFSKNMTLYAVYDYEPSYDSVKWKKINNKWYIVDENGLKYRNVYYYDKYYFNANGVMVTGWYRNKGKWQYYNDSGLLQRGWKKIGNKWYYFRNSSDAHDVEMVVGWSKISGKWYYFNTSGAMQTGWKKLSGKWYYFESSGAMVTGTKTINGKTYKFDSSGVCLNP